MKPSYLAVAVLVAALLGAAIYTHFDRPERGVNNDVAPYENAN